MAQRRIRVELVYVQDGPDVPAKLYSETDRGVFIGAKSNGYSRFYPWDAIKCVERYDGKDDSAEWDVDLPRFLGHRGV